MHRDESAYWYARIALALLESTLISTLLAILVARGLAGEEAISVAALERLYLALFVGVAIGCAVLLGALLTLRPWRFAVSALIAVALMSAVLLASDLVGTP